jgi:hypothetical protein
MTDFLPYPGSAPAPAPAPASEDRRDPSDRYVVAVTCNLNEGLGGVAPLSAPMTYEAAQDLMAQVAAGAPCEVLPHETDLVAEVGPGHLVAYRAGSLMRKEVTYDVRLGRVVFSR